MNYQNYHAQWVSGTAEDGEIFLNSIAEHGVVKTLMIPLLNFEKTPETIHGLYTKFSEHLGSMVPMDEDLTTGNKTGNRWIEVKYDFEIKDSYRHSNTRQPLHTDGAYEANAPDIAFLYSLKCAKVGGYTTFIHVDELIECLTLGDPILLSLLKETPIKFSKGNDSKTNPIIRYENDKARLTWNYFRVSEDNDEKAITVASRFHDFLENVVTQLGTLKQIKLEPGEGVFFDDERVLHGRTSFLGDRHLIKGGIRLERP